MIIIIDAYNLLKQLFSKNRSTTDQQVKFLLSRLSYYKKFKEKAIKDILLVFDAGPFGHATREVKQGIVVIHSGQKSDADEWIINFTKKNVQDEITVVTQDRKLIQLCQAKHVFSLPPLEFYKIVSVVYLDQHQEELHEQLPTGMRKLDTSDVYTEDLAGMEQDGAGGQSLDLLLEEYSMTVPREKKDEFGEAVRGHKKQNKSSKDEKVIEKKIKKLW